MSVLVTALLLALPVIVTLAVPRAPLGGRWLIAVLPWTILGATALFAVRGFFLDRNCLVVQRLGWNTRIPLQGLQSVTVDPDAMKGSLRLAGNGGLFAFTGLFRNQKLGLYRAYVTDPRRCVVLRLPKRPIVVSPDNPNEFVAAAKAEAGIS